MPEAAGTAGESLVEGDGAIDPFAPVAPSALAQGAGPDLAEASGGDEARETLPPAFRSSLDRIEAIGEDTRSAGYQRAADAYLEDLASGPLELGEQDATAGSDDGSDLPGYNEFEAQQLQGETVSAPTGELPGYNEFSPDEPDAGVGADAERVPDGAGGTSLREYTPEEIEERSDDYVWPVVGGSPGTGPDGQSMSRTGEVYNQYNAAEVALGMRFDHQDGELLSVEFDVPRDPGNEGTREGKSFTLDPYLRAIDADQMRTSSLTNLEYDRGHAAAQANSQGDEDVARELMRSTNVWAMRGSGPRV